MPRNIGNIAKMQRAGFPVSHEAHERLRSYGRVVANIFLEDKLSPNVHMRAGSLDYLDRSGDLIQLADMGDPGGSGPLDREIAGLYLAVVGQLTAQLEPGVGEPQRQRRIHSMAEAVPRYRAAGVSPASLDACLPLPARPALVWRGRDWMISAAGMRPGFGGIEMYGWVTPPCNAYTCNGSVQVMRKGDPHHAVGFEPANGWDWSLWPAATSLVKRDFELTSRQRLAGGRNESPIGGVLAIGSGKNAAGLFSMSYKGQDFQRDELTFCKSIFTFGGRVLVMTSGITSTAPFPCATTLYQEHLDRPASPMGELSADAPLKTPSGIRYAVLAGPQTGSTLHAMNRHQSWRMPSPSRIKPGIQYPPLLNLLGFNQLAPWKDLPSPSKQALSASTDEMLNDFVPGEGDFAVAYLDHGVKPTDAACAFLMSVSGEANADSIRVKRLDADAHCAYDEVAKSWVYSSFKHDTTWMDCGVVKHTGRSVTLLVKEDSGRLQLTLTSWEEKNTEAYSVTLEGRWSVDAGPATAKTEANETILTVPYAGDQSRDVVLKELR